MLPLVSPQNNIWEMSTRIQYCWCDTTQFLVVLLIGRKWRFCAHSSVVISLENQWWHHKMLAVFSGNNGTLIYKPLCNEVLSIMNDIPCLTKSRICGKEPQYNETSSKRTYFVGLLAVCYIFSLQYSFFFSEKLLSEIIWH